MTVVCGHAEIDPDDPQTITNPIVIVEVLSPGTADYDRVEKTAHYKRIPSLRELVLVAHDTRQLEVWRRDEGGAWTHSAASSGAVSLPSVGCTLSVADAYRDELASA